VNAAPETPAAHTVSTHVLDTSAGRPARDIPVRLSVRRAGDAPWAEHAAAVTDADGRCAGLPALPPDTRHALLRFEVEPYLARAGAAFFPEVTVAFAVTAGEHHHVPLLLTPFGYTVYRGS
jgi:hydroxyisourate hydrolase